MFRLLGDQFSPRLADLPERRYWRLNPRAGYGAFNRVATNRIRRQLIEDHWPDICRVAGTLHTKAATASDLIRVLQRSGHPTTLGRAIAELGRIVQTITTLGYVSDEANRRRVLVQLNRTEGRHDLARAVSHGRRGDLYQAYRTGQEDQLGVLGLVVNAIALFNTRYMDRAVNHARDRGRSIDDHDLERLSPLVREHIELHGRYSFSLPEAVLSGELAHCPGWPDELFVPFIREGRPDRSHPASPCPLPSGPADWPGSAGCRSLADRAYRGRPTAPANFRED